MRSLLLKIYLYILYFFYILPKAFLNFLVNKDVLKLKLGKYDSLLDDYNKKHNIDSKKVSKNKLEKEELQETPDDKYPLW